MITGDETEQKTIRTDYGLFTADTAANKARARKKSTTDNIYKNYTATPQYDVTKDYIQTTI